MSARAKRSIGAGVVAVAFVVGCGDSSGTTAGKRIELRAKAAPVANFSAFTTGFGWDVTLTRAAVAVSALYYFDGPPPTAFRTPTNREKIERFIGLGTAWAHPGHYQAGTALGQSIFPAPTAVDLFATPTALASGDGITGIYRSARFVFAQSAPVDTSLSGHIALVEGKAVKHGTADAPVFFRLIADYADLSQNVNNGAVDGCVFNETDIEADGEVTVTVKPSVWLNLVDFSKIAAGTEEAPTETTNAGFSQGVTQLSAYQFSYAK